MVLFDHDHNMVRPWKRDLSEEEAGRKQQRPQDEYRHAAHEYHQHREVKPEVHSVAECRGNGRDLAFPAGRHGTFLHDFSLI